MSGSPDMACQELVERVTDYLEGAIEAPDRRRLEEHLAVCPHCDLYLEQLRLTLELTGELREADVAPEMREELLDAFSRWQRSPRP